MSEMSMNRAIHGAFRRDIARFLEALGDFEDGDLYRARQLAGAWANFRDQLDRHHRGEHEFTWPALVAYGVSPSTIEQLDSEHDAMARALADAEEAMSTLRRTASGADDARSAMLLLQEVTYAHLEHEESITEPLFVEHRDDEVIKEMGRRHGRAFSPLAAGRFLAWVLDGATDDERRGITDNVPGPVVALVGGVLGAPYRWRVAPTWHASVGPARDQEP